MDDVAAYVAVPGGRVEVIADFGDERLWRHDPVEQALTSCPTGGCGESRERQAGMIGYVTIVKINVQQFLSFLVDPCAATVLPRSPARG